MKASTTTVRLFTDVGLLMKSRMQRALPLPFGQCQALWFVQEEGRPNMQDIATHFKITAPSATFLVEELVRGKYLARRANAKDRRKIEVVLTQKGIRACSDMAQKRTVVISGLMKALSEEERGDLDRILGKIIKSA